MRARRARISWGPFLLVVSVASAQSLTRVAQHRAQCACSWHLKFDITTCFSVHSDFRILFLYLCTELSFALTL